MEQHQLIHQWSKQPWIQWQLHVWIRESLHLTLQMGKYHTGRPGLRVVRHDWLVGAELWLSHCSPVNLLIPLCLPRRCSAHPLVQAWGLTGTVVFLGSSALASASCLLAVTGEVTAAFRKRKPGIQTLPVLNGEMCWVETGYGLGSAGNNINRCHRALEAILSQSHQCLCSQ